MSNLIIAELWWHFEITTQNNEDLKPNYEPHINYNGRLYMPIVPQTYIIVA